MSEPVVLPEPVVSEDELPVPVCFFLCLRCVGVAVPWSELVSDEPVPAMPDEVSDEPLLPLMPDEEPAEVPLSLLVVPLVSGLLLPLEPVPEDDPEPDWSLPYDDEPEPDWPVVEPALWACAALHVPSARAAARMPMSLFISSPPSMRSDHAPCVAQRQSWRSTPGPARSTARAPRGRRGPRSDRRRGAAHASGGASSTWFGICSWGLWRMSSSQVRCSSAPSSSSRRGRPDSS